MREEVLDFGRKSFTIRLPDNTHILSMGKPVPLSRPKEKIKNSLKNPIASLPLKDLVRRKLVVNPRAKAVIVISDDTRPVPYSGDSGILFPVVKEIMDAGLSSQQILILVATGTHRAMRDDELKKTLDPRIFSLGLRIKSHDCTNKHELASVGKANSGSEILLNRLYLESDIKILTGLVESHFMAGASGGRKSICPGLISKDSISVLHGGQILTSPMARDMVLDGNPVHEESLRIARIAGCDMIVNVTLDSDYRLTGIFTGHLEKAHQAAVAKLRRYAAIPAERKYDLILTHAGYVGVNHYQAAKAAVAAAPIFNKNGICILAAYHSDPDPIGGKNYKKMMRLLGQKGREKFMELITGPDWTFVPEQWEAQMWAKFFKIIPPDNLLYCSFEISKES